MTLIKLSTAVIIYKISIAMKALFLFSTLFNIDELKIKTKKIEQEIELSDNYELVPEEYMPVYKYISKTPINVDELCKKTKLEISKVNYILTMLELEGYIEQLPGKNFVR